MRILKEITTNNVQQYSQGGYSMLFEITGVEIELDGLFYDVCCDVSWNDSGDETIESFEVYYNGDEVDVVMTDDQQQFIVDAAMVNFDSDRDINRSIFIKDSIYNHDR
jgi:hypothetical protein